MNRALGIVLALVLALATAATLLARAGKLPG